MKECGQLNLKKVWYLQRNIKKRAMIILKQVIRRILSKILNWERPNKCYFRIEHIGRWRRWIIYVKRVSHLPFLCFHIGKAMLSHFSLHIHTFTGAMCSTGARCFGRVRAHSSAVAFFVPPPVDLNAHVNLLLIWMRSGTFILICMYMCTHTL